MVRAPTIADLAVTRPRVERCFEAGALATGCDARDRRRVTRVLAHGSRRRHRRVCTATNAIALGRVPDDENEDDVLDRHGQRLARDALDPSVHRDRERRRVESSARVRGGVHQRVGRPRGARRLARRWRGPRSTSRPARCATACSRTEAQPFGAPTTTTQSVPVGRRRRRRRDSGMLSLAPFDPTATASAVPSRSRPARQYTVLPVCVCPIQSCWRRPGSCSP